MRTPIIAGNWKLNKTISESTEFVASLQSLLGDFAGAEVVLCPVFTALHATKTALGDSPIALAGQDMYWKESGAYTGEVSASLLKDAGAKYVILGHSERRGRFGVPEPDLEGQAGAVFGDSDQSVNKKLVAALENGLVPVVCVGETLSERQNGHTDAVVENQIVMALNGIEASQIAGIVFAYEPVWAIGTGETCEADEANRVCGVIRATISSGFGEAAAQATRIQYGGSVKPENAAQLLSLEHIDGALVGGASLKADSFAAIIKAAL
ncbi:triosephosphate isomerase [Abditibacterium utsteinense]|uniref:Triosephosphate isomerase n=1 Tax=Abditibacterium utsteinense TaxID=1960156 RepID=A0A2S8SQM8_9BACT|nr:triose-phosphate isomerase [Abditibacterium utsteinense]PQV63103.1 triosephosphate isomerase [Abditibacterium utsteinense]